MQVPVLHRARAIAPARTSLDSAQATRCAERARYRRRLIGAALVFGILLVPGCATQIKAPDAEHTDKVRVERKDREFDLDTSIRRVEIVNRYGDITVKRQNENAVGIHAVIQRLTPTFASLRLTSRREAGTLHIEVAYAKGVDPATPGRLDMAVFLPGTEPLALTTRDGTIDANRREGAITASSVSGRIRASSRGRLVLHSDSGDIIAGALGKHWSGTSRIETGSGRIVLLVPTFGGITLDASTGGKLSSNFGLSIHARAGGASTHARYGDGRSPLVVTSDRGEVILEQLVLIGDDGALPEDDD
ncbi:MAG: hypothetical protein WB784_03475 [Rhodanobacteraceae bacterium]